MSDAHAETLMNVLEKRRAYRAFSDRALDRRELLPLFEAARLAPSAFNEQPWRYLAATAADNPDTFARLLSCLTERNQSWAGRAPALLVSLARKTFGERNTANRWHLHDAGLTMANFMAAAAARGLVAHPMAGFSPDKVRQAFPAIPEDFEPVVMVAVGYQGDPGVLESEKDRETETSPRARRPVAEFAFDGEWGKSFR